jgi:hypothetical protein
LAKQLKFVYHPSSDEIVEEKVRQVQQKIVAFLVEKAMQKAANER